MPTYEYVCTKCGQHVEVVQGFNDPPLTACANCRGTLRKVFHPAGIVFKGSGFYRTEGRGSGGKRSRDGAKPASKESAASTSGESSAPTSKKDTKEKTA